MLNKKVAFINNKFRQILLFLLYFTIYYIILSMREINDIKKMIKKRYKKNIWRPFIKAIKEFNLLEENDKVAIAFSGGKDSVLLSFLFEELRQYSDFNFDVCYIAIDPGIKQLDGTPTPSSEKLKALAKDMQIDLNIYESTLFDYVNQSNVKSPCFLCSKIRRGFLYERAKELGANKLALGHHLDDVIETILMNVMYQGKYMTMMPKIKSKNFENITLIRPMYYIEENVIRKFLKGAEIESLIEECPLKDENTGARHDVKMLIENLSKDIPNFKNNVQKSAHNVYIEAIIATKEES